MVDQSTAIGALPIAASPRRLSDGLSTWLAGDALTSPTSISAGDAFVIAGAARYFEQDGGCGPDVDAGHRDLRWR
jgi:hypothetical protein